MANESWVQLPVDSSGKRTRTVSATVAGFDVHNTVVNIGDYSTSAIAGLSFQQSITGVNVIPYQNTPANLQATVTSNIGGIWNVNASGSISAWNFPGTGSYPSTQSGNWSISAFNTQAASAFLVSASSMGGSITAIQGASASLANAWPVFITDGINILGTTSNTLHTQGRQSSRTGVSVTTSSIILGPLPVTYYNIATVTISGNYNGVSLIWEGSDDSINWYALQGSRGDSFEVATGMTLASTSNRSYDVAVGALASFRVRSTAYASGTAGVGVAFQTMPYESAPAAGSVGLSKMTNPTSALDGSNIVNIYDKVGRQVVVPFHVKELVLQSATTITTVVESNLLLPSGVGVTNDLTTIIVTGLINPLQKFDFRDSKGGTIRFSLVVSSACPVAFLNLTNPIYSTSANGMWTVQSSIASPSAIIFAQAVNNI